jgi:GNAT superfamily N-acetyltransferase
MREPASFGSQSLEVRQQIQADDIEATGQVWHESKQAAYGFLPAEMALTLEEDEAIFRQYVLPGKDTWVAVQDGAVLGFLTLSGSYVARLYVQPERQGTGVGSQLLEHAKQCSRDGLELHTHQKNTQAREFHERRGFIAVKFGISPSPESEPDVEYHWRPDPEKK